MSTYELDDDLVRRVLSGRTTGTEQDALFLKLEAQIPIPAPNKIGAVVRTVMEVRGLRIWVRSSTDGHTPNPWHELNCSDEPAMPTDQIGRITEVLSEGVDL